MHKMPTIPTILTKSTIAITPKKVKEAEGAKEVTIEQAEPQLTTAKAEEAGSSQNFRAEDEEYSDA